jgi:hypothetical protein
MTWLGIFLVSAQRVDLDVLLGLFYGGDWGWWLVAQ